MIRPFLMSSPMPMSCRSAYPWKSSAERAIIAKERSHEKLRVLTNYLEAQSVDTGRIQVPMPTTKQAEQVRAPTLRRALMPTGVGGALGLLLGLALLMQQGRTRTPDDVGEMK